MAVKAMCIVTQSDKDKGAYGIRVDNDENVYFPFSVAESIGLEDFEEVEVIMVKSDRPEPAPPWKAIRARRTDEDNDDTLSS